MSKLQIYAYGIAPNIWTERNKNFRHVEHFPNARQVIICRQWLARYATPAKTKNNPKSSYWLKHKVERMAGEYVSNGALIQAAFDLGFQYKHRQNSINVGFFINLKPEIYRPIQGRN